MAKLRLPSRPRLILILLSLLAFGNAIRGSFHFDDYAIFNPSTSWKTRLFSWLSFWLNEQVAGRDPLWWHAVDLLLHVGCVVVLFECARRMTNAWTALFAAALFAIHPIQTEAVAYVFARATLLMTLFCLLSWLAWLGQRRWMAVAFFALALLSKEECVFFPLVLWLTDRRLESSRTLSTKPLPVMLVLSFAAGWNVIAATRVVQGSGAGFSAGISAMNYAIAQGSVLWLYLMRIVVPIGFTVDPDLHPPPAAGIAGWAAILACLIVFRKRQEWVWFAAAFVLLLASSSVFPAADLAADRRMYLPMVPLAIGIALFLIRLPRWVPAALAVVLIPLSVARTEVWRTEQSLWSDAVEKAPNKVRPRLQLARALPPEEGLRVLEDIEKAHPEDPDIPAEKGRIFLQSSHPESAISAFGRAAALRPNDAQAWSNLGVALAMVHQDQAAAAQFQHALKLNPCLADALRNLRRPLCPSGP